MNKLFLAPLLLVAVGVFLVKVGLSAETLSFYRDGLMGTLSQLAASLQREAVLEDEERATLARMQAREEVLADLRAEKISLLEAAARFGALNRQIDNGDRHTLRAFRGNSEGERLCRQVIQRVKYREPDQPDPEALAFRHRLEAQLEELLQRDGMVQLPETDASRR
jgi:hypothetical protein